MALADPNRVIGFDAFNMKTRQDVVARSAESGTTATPSVSVLGVALGVVALSWLFFGAGRDLVNLIGQWARRRLVI